MKKIFFVVVVVTLALVSLAPVIPANAAPEMAGNGILECADPPIAPTAESSGECIDYGDYIEIEFSFSNTTSHHPSFLVQWGHSNEAVSNHYWFKVDVYQKVGNSQACLGTSTVPYVRRMLYEAVWFTPDTGFYNLMDVGNTDAQTCISTDDSFFYKPNNGLVGIKYTLYNEWGASVSWHGIVRISVVQDCTDYSDGNFVTLSEDVFEIDPTIENPQGIVGEQNPIDEQIYPTVANQYYRLYTYGKWNDGTNDKEDVAISWDGVTWEELPPGEPVCQVNLATGPVMGYVWYFIAESETFHIRANDDGMFADNTNGDPPLTYSMGISVLIYGANCESQFDYSEDDWVASVLVPSTSETGVLASSSLTAGYWYAIKISSGDWRDDGADPPRIDLEFSNPDPSLPLDPVFVDLADGSDLVWCQTEDGYITFVQAKSPKLYLRVNDAPGDFATNTGTVGVNIYQASFTRSEAACETVFERGQLISSGEVLAVQEGGKQFAYSVGSEALNANIGLEPGAWYYLETTGGAWWWKGSIHQDSAISYDMAVSEDGETWVSLADWERAECNIAIDALGHRGVYFQIPETANIEWFLRVDDTALWWNNAGSMGWNLYGASRLDVELSPGQACDFAWSDNPIRGGYIPATSEGEPLYLYPQGTATSSYYAIEILGNDYYWQEQTGGDPLYGMQISIDGGTTWSKFPEDYVGSLCTIQTGRNTVTFVKVVRGQDWKIRVDSSTFSDNLLGMGINIYAAEPGNTLDPWTSCFDDSSMFKINSLTYIPVKDEAGIYINGTNILTGGNEIQLLQPTETYKLQIEEGPWTNGEGASSYIAAISADNGQTWYAIDDQNNPNIICGDTDFTGQHRSIYFTVQAGQKWKIRVNDQAGKFNDNGGNLAYSLYSVYGDEDVPPVDVSIPPAVVNNVCTQPLIRPSSILEVSAWVNYARLGIQKYFAWCPQHTDILLALFNGLKSVEPFATISELATTMQSAKTEISSYNWSSEGEDFSILTKSPSESFQMFVEHTSAPQNNPWETGILDIRSFSNFEMPESYTACQEYLAPQTGARLAQGVCYASAIMLLTGASFWLQLILDIGIGLVLIKAWIGAAEEAIAMATGVALIKVPSGGGSATVEVVRRR